MKIKLYGAEITYRCVSDITSDINALETLIHESQKPVIITGDWRVAEYNIGDDPHGFRYRWLPWLAGEMSPRDFLDAISTEDKEWTEERNRGLTGIFFRKVTLEPNAQSAIIAEANRGIRILTEMKNKMAAEKAAEKASAITRHAVWRETRSFQCVMPEGGEDGIDGYIDAEYTNADDDTVRMISRSVFDFGVYHYPKRVEGTDDVFSSEKWEDAERSAVAWLAEFSPFQIMRM